MLLNHQPFAPNYILVRTCCSFVSYKSIIFINCTFNEWPSRISKKYSLSSLLRRRRRRRRVQLQITILNNIINEVTFTDRSTIVFTVNWTIDWGWCPFVTILCVRTKCVSLIIIRLYNLIKSNKISAFDRCKYSVVLGHITLYIKSYLF